MIALLTPTGARPVQFNLCQRFMKRQTYAGDVVWIIIDDCLPRSSEVVPANFRANWTIIKVNPLPVWRPGQNTQGRNMEAGVNALLTNFKRHEIDAVFIIEDDDYYRATYLERMMLRWDNCDAIGETRTIYYNPVYRRYALNGNTGYASLFQTAFNIQMIETFRGCKGAKFIDGAFWKQMKRKILFHENDLAIGMKGLPGRAGIGAGHAYSYYGMAPDLDMRYLTKLIGNDAKIYEGYYRLNDSVQYRGLNQKRRKLL